MTSLSSSSRRARPSDHLATALRLAKAHGLSRRSRTALGVLRDERSECFPVGHAREAMLRASLRPRVAFARAGLDEWDEPLVIVEHRRTQVDHVVHALRPREQ